MTAIVSLPEGFVLDGTNHPDCAECLAEAARLAAEIADQPLALGSSTVGPPRFVEPQMHGAKVTHVERTRAAEQAEREATLDLATNHAPTGRVEMGDRGWRVMASAFVPARPAWLPGHHAILALVNGDPWADDAPAPALDAPRFAVSTLVHDDDVQESYWHSGTYDLTYAEALAEFARRTTRDARRMRALAGAR